jgi:glycerol-1-phosphate dehydrogenase [NAD(P)+]
VTKYAAELARTPYVCAATARLDGRYAASGAAMLEDGFKRHARLRTTVAVIADLDVIARAPRRMAAWGYGDLAGKLVAGADWLLAAPWARTARAAALRAGAGQRQGMLSAPARVAAHDVDALRGLVDGLLISGFAMQRTAIPVPPAEATTAVPRVGDGAPDRRGRAAAHGAAWVSAPSQSRAVRMVLAQDVPAPRRRIDANATLDVRRIEPKWTRRLPSAARRERARRDRAKLARAERVRRACRPWRCVDDAAPALERALVPADVLQQWLRACGAASHRPTSALRRPSSGRLPPRAADPSPLHDPRLRRGLAGWIGRSTSSSPFRLLGPAGRRRI